MLDTLKTESNGTNGKEVEWLGKREVAQALEIGEMSVTVTAKRLEFRTKDGRDRASGQVVKLYHAGDVERERHFREHPGERPLPESTAVEKAGVDSSGKAARGAGEVELWKLVTAALGNRLAPVYPEAMTVGQAAGWSGLPERWLSARIKDGQLAAIDLGSTYLGGRYRLTRRVLDEFLGRQGRDRA